MRLMRLGAPGPSLVTADEVPHPGNPYLRPGDVVSLEIDALGAQTQRFAEA
jgi:hypothetical protein